MKPLLLKYIVFFSLLLSQQSFAAKQGDSITLDPIITTRSYLGLVEEYFNGVLRTTKLLTQTSEAQSGEWEKVKPLLTQLSKNIPIAAVVWFMKPDGSYYSAETGTLTDQNLKDRAYYPHLIKGHDVLGDLVISKSTGYRSIIIASPVVLNSKTIAAIGVSLRADLLSEIVNEHLKLPTNTYFYALDSDAKIALHRYADRTFKAVAEVGDENLEKEFKSLFKLENGMFEYNLKGKKISAIFQKSPTLGWYFFIAQEKVKLR